MEPGHASVLTQGLALAFVLGSGLIMNADPEIDGNTALQTKLRQSHPAHPAATSEDAAYLAKTRAAASFTLEQSAGGPKTVQSSPNFKISITNS